MCLRHMDRHVDPRAGLYGCSYRRVMIAIQRNSHLLGSNLYRVLIQI